MPFSALLNSRFFSEGVPLKTIQISLPNSLDNFILVEMCERLKEGQTVTMLFGGRSMLPLINGEGDKIQLRPLAEGEKCVPGEVYLFRHLGHYIIHRLMWIKGDDYVFRGDNCYAYEHEGRENVLAKLIVIEKPDGTQVNCETEEWRSLSRKVLRRRKIKNTVIRFTNQGARKKWSILYFVLLAILMWAPLNGLAPVLNNYIFGLRADHFLHATVFLFCPLHRHHYPRLLRTQVLRDVFHSEKVTAHLPFQMGKNVLLLPDFF
jgi:signal peptidase I